MEPHPYDRSEPAADADAERGRPAHRDLVALAMIPGVGPRSARALLAKFGDARAILSASIASLREVEGVGPKLAERINASRREIDLEAELELCSKHGVGFIAETDDEYPRLLREIPDPPILLYAQGAPAAADAMSIAIVGSRHATPYGVRIAERLAASLARTGLTIVSGLARGIDAAAHRGALKAGGRTIAVLANGLADVYPPEHAELAREVSASGAVISEMSMRQAPRSGLFPQRNRIISGLSLGVVVVEAAPRSGSLSTARHAVEQNREVFAVPGSIESLSSRGCHALLRDGAKLVESADDILEELGPLASGIRLKPDEPVVKQPLELTLNDQERLVLKELEQSAVTIDELIARTRLAASQIMATLSILEMRRLVKRLPGQQFIRT